MKKLGNTNIVKLLIHFGADINNANQLGVTALHFAAEKGSFWNSANDFEIFFHSNLIRWSSLIEIAFFLLKNLGHEVIVRILANKGADINALDRMGSSAQIIAIRRGTNFQKKKNAFNHLSKLMFCIHWMQVMKILQCSWISGIQSNSMSLSCPTIII